MRRTLPRVIPLVSGVFSWFLIFKYQIFVKIIDIYASSSSGQITTQALAVFLLMLCAIFPLGVMLVMKRIIFRCIGESVAKN